MIILPDFIKNIQYRKLSPKEGKRLYRFQLLEPLQLQTTTPLFLDNVVLSFRDNQNREWLKLKKHSIEISGLYAWNGASPKRHVRFIGWVGPPDFEKTILATLVHDALCQFLRTPYFPIPRAGCDRIFKEIMEKKNFKLSGLYYSGAKFGTSFYIGGTSGPHKSVMSHL